MTEDKLPEPTVLVRVFTSDCGELPRIDMDKKFFVDYAIERGATFVEDGDTLIINAKDGAALYFPMAMTGRRMTARIYFRAEEISEEVPATVNPLYYIYKNRVRGNRTLDEFHRLVTPHESKMPKGSA